MGKSGALNDLRNNWRCRRHCAPTIRWVRPRAQPCLQARRPLAMQPRAANCTESPRCVIDAKRTNTSGPVLPDAEAAPPAPPTGRGPAVRRQGCRPFRKNNALSIVLLALFVVFWIAQAAMGWAVHNGELQQLGQRFPGFGAYLLSAHFWSATAENWESEFLQMGAYVVLTVYLKQRGSAESNPYPEEETDDDRERQRRDAQARGFLKRHGLSVALLGPFMGALLLHLCSSISGLRPGAAGARSGRPDAGPVPGRAGVLVCFRTGKARF